MPFKFKISADILGVISGDRIIKVLPRTVAKLDSLFALFNYILQLTGSSQWRHIRCGFRTLMILCQTSACCPYVTTGVVVDVRTSEAVVYLENGLN